MKLRNLVTGQVLLREGDPPGPIYIITTGRLRVYRRDYATLDSYTDVALLGNGDVIGELGPILARPRSATVQALDPSTVLEIQPDELPRLAQQHEPLVRVITTALRDRAGVPGAELARMAERMGLTLPASFSRDDASQMRGSAGPAIPPHDAAVVYPKVVQCPACRLPFAALTLRAHKDTPSARESDFHNLYTTAYNPYDYEVWVCPNDGYGALPLDFPDLAERHRAGVTPSVDKVIETWAGDMPEFNVDRTLHLRDRSLQLALGLYEMRGMAPARLAAITHRLAWVARERGDTELEQTWLARALEHYTAAFERSDLRDAKEELRVRYLCGELTLRLGDAARAVVWFGEALRHPQVKNHANWERQLREQIAVAREQMTTEPQAA